MLIAALLLGGCGHWQSGPDAPFVRWKCQSQQNIAWRYADDQHSAIDLKVGNDERIHTLRKEPATSGSFYSDGVLAFHAKGNDARVYPIADAPTMPHGCSALPIRINRKNVG